MSTLFSNSIGGAGRCILLVVCYMCFAGSYAWAEDFALPRLSKVLYPEQKITLYLPGTLVAQDAACLPAAVELFEAQSRYGIRFETLPGKGGALAINKLLMEPADGYVGALVHLPGFYLHLASPDPAYRKEEMAVTDVFAAMPLALWVVEDSPWKTFADFLGAARGMPAGYFVVSGNGSYTGAHMASEQLDRAAGIVTMYQPLLDTAAAADAVRAGKAHACIAGALSPEHLSGLRPLAVMAPTRSLVLPQTPTFTEVGCPLVQYEYAGFVVAAKTPSSRQDDFTRFISSVVHGSAFQDILRNAGYTPFSLTKEGLEELLATHQKVVDEFMDNYVLQ